MTIEATANSKNLAKFQALLRELFQFDCADLDFGIYRIMNHKREVVEQFISERLPKLVDDELGAGPLAQQVRAEADFEQARQNVLKTLGPVALRDDGDLTETYRNSLIGKQYLAARDRAADRSRSRDVVEASIYNHLYTFFNRYYEDGDFISKRRYGRNNRYAIPYNGEEVYLHWANSDQYYVKTDEHFRNYDWKAPNGVAVHFRLHNADIEQNNVKGDRRFFIPLVPETYWDSAAKTVTIPFEYRPLTGSETAKYGKRNQQDAIIKEAVAAIPQRLSIDAPLAALTGEHRREGEAPVPLLEHHLRRYVRRNNSDFFIHKDLAGFLNRELDFYLKNEALNLDNLIAAGEDLAGGWFQELRLTKSVGSRIIEFLAQIEDYQKLLWEKRKFVTETQYCITLGQIAPEFYPDIAANEPQWAEWRDLFNVDDSDRSANFFDAHPTLVVDTKHYDGEFVDHLLASFPNLGDTTDGLLIHSENWQALRTLEEGYRESVQCVYIDPPYNAKATEIIYKNEYKHSSWLSLVANRIEIARALQSPTSVFAVAIDDNEQEKLGLLLDYLFPDHLKTCVSVVHNPGGVQGDNFSYTNEFAYFVYPQGHRSVGLEDRPMSPDIRPLRDVSTGSHLRQDAANCFYPVYAKEQVIVGFGEVCDDEFHPSSPNVSMEDGTIAIYPIDAQGLERKWVFSRRNVEKIQGELTVQWNRSRKIWDVIRRKTAFNYKTVWDSKKYNSNSFGSRFLNNIFGTKVFDFPKSIHTVEDSVRLSTRDEIASNCVLDYFAGSGTTGHAVINLNREDGQARKFILVEMGGYFDTVLLPRIKKITFAPEWKRGKPQREATAEEAERSPRIVEYLRLESYEDALDSIEFDSGAGRLPFTETDESYLLKYMLNWETKDSETLLNPAKLTRPFSYRLRVHVNGEKQERPVDLPETFNFLLGLKVRTRRVFHDDGRRYLVYRGEPREAPGREVAVVWRETDSWSDDDFERDREFVEQREITGGTDVVYVNGDSCIPGAKPLEPMFKARMFAGVNA